MKPPTISGIVHVGLDILTTVVNASTKRILAQTGDVVKDATDSDGAEWWQHVGFASRPPKPQAGKQAAQAVVLKTSDRDVVIGSVDQRGLALYGNLDHGESCLYAAGEDGEAQARVLLKKDGSINLYTRKGNTNSGAGLIVQIDAVNGAIRLINDKGYGIIIDSDGVKITSGSACLTLDSSGNARLIGKGQAQVDGSGIVLGSAAVLGVNSALTGVTALDGKPSTKVLIET